MSGQRRLGLQRIVGALFSLVFLGFGLWAVRTVLQDLLLKPWRTFLAGGGPAPWLPTLLMAVFFGIFLSVPVRMLFGAIWGIHKSQEALAAEKLRTAGALPLEPHSPQVPYRSATGGSVVDRYRPMLAAAPFPVLAGRQGSHLPLRLASLSARASKGNRSNLAVGIPMALFLAVILVGLLRSGAVSSALMVLPFLAVAVFLIWPWIRPLLSGALLDPRVEIDRNLVVMGQPFRVFVEQPGPARISNMAVRLVCIEHVTYTQGTNTYHDAREVQSIDLVQELSLVITKREPFTRSLEATIPVDSMHSFVSDNNRVEWGVRVEAEIENWPDVKQTYPIAVLPGA